MEEMVYQFFLEHGWKLTLLSISGIFLLGVLKYFDVFKKLSENQKKVVYAIVSACFSIAVCGVYLVCVDRFSWTKFGLLSLGVFGVNQSVYTVYENYGIRTLVKRLGTLFAGFVAKKHVANTNENSEAIAENGKDKKIVFSNMDELEDSLEEPVTEQQPKEE